MGLLFKTPVYHSIIAHKDSNIAIQLSDRYVNPKLFPGYLKQDYSTIIPAEYLMSVSLATEVEHIIESVMPDEQIQTLLKIKAIEPCLILHRRTWINDIVATKNRFVYPGSRHQIGGRFKPISNSHPVLT